MNKEQIIELLIKQIPESKLGEKPKHPLNYHVHITRKYSVLKMVHPFILMLAEVLENIEQAEPGYAERIVKWICSLSNHDQIYAVLSEILVLNQVVNIADEINGKPYIISEPKTKANSKNPEFRSCLNGLYYTGEVKTPSLTEYSILRQEGFQITTHLPKRNVISTDKIVQPTVYKIKDFLINTQKKFEEYIKVPERKNDYRFLFLVWDDFVNEPISALLNPYCGLFTENYFYPSNFELIDGVFIMRHLHQFNRIIRKLEEFLNGIEHAFQWNVRQLPIAFIQNPKGRKVPDTFLINFDGVNPKDLFFVAEYRPTDWIDWRTGIAITGLYQIPTEYHSQIFEHMFSSVKNYEPRVLNDAANFGTINIDIIVEECRDSNGNVNYKEAISKIKKAISIAIKAQYYWELKEKENLEKEAKSIQKGQIELLTRSLRGESLDSLRSEYLNKIKPSVKVTREKKSQKYFSP